MQKTIFNELHLKAGAKMVEFAGFEMPIQYKNGIIHEHKTVRNLVGIFDVSHMGEFEIKGKDALAFVQKISINDASKLVPGGVQYSAMCLPTGGIVDDMLVYKINDEFYMLVVNGACEEKDWQWCVKNSEGFDIDLRNESQNINLLAVQGPKSLETIQKLTDSNLSDIKYYNFVLGKVDGIDMIISRTGYTGELGFELYFRGGFPEAEKLWNSLMNAGEEFGIELVGLACRDTLRLEKGYCLYGNDIDETTNPLEAGLGWITKLQKGSFNGFDAIAKVKADGLKKKLVGFIVNADRVIPRHHYKIFNNGEEIGVVTSGNLSPMLDKPIGMGYVKIDFAEPGSLIQIEVRGKLFPAEVIKLPFV